MAEGFSDRLVGRSAAHRSLLDVLGRIAGTDAEVLLHGPTGVGKELYGRYLHASSGRRDRRFVPVNCGAIPDNLFENEFFGHVGGAFTGAAKRHDGLASYADGGTLLLDEVDSLAPGNQTKLLRFLQEKEFRPLGAARPIRVDARIVAATNADLVERVREGSFRRDLFFRLRVVPLHVPALRERPEDIDPLLDSFTRRYAAEYGRPAVRWTADARRVLHDYPWPGNIRELENCVRCLTALHPGEEIGVADLDLLDPRVFEEGGVAPPAQQGFDPALGFQAAKQQVVDGFERGWLTQALARSGGNIAEAARSSGKHRRAFFELMRKHGVEAGDYRG